MKKIESVYENTFWRLYKTKNILKYKYIEFIIFTVLFCIRKHIQYQYT